MKVATRKTSAGTEYWDTEAKQTRFVPAGKKAPFEVTENPKSMLDKDTKGKGAIAGSNGEKLDPNKTPDTTGLGSMTVPVLKTYAANKGITVPKEITRKDDIILFIQESEEKQQDDKTEE
ncbi:hypothetical protein [Terribacillus saccharophilus]|uniref:hypothetical protein n=1 Tax=Terribacillus saccharophilus TaxID=361277 RepID=UPI002DC8ACEC|nr:hypothetical protein [Terribacillus saccharophilus]MEC0288927.1 hypothetical protein [Terribacillus saccharophilus]